MGELIESLNNNGSDQFGLALLSSIEDLGLSILSKTDFETFMFHHILLHLDKTKIKNNYDLMRLLKITPSKLRSLEMNRSAKFLNLDLSNIDNWRMIFNALDGKKIETEDKDNGKVRIYIEELHVHRLIERFVVEGGSSIDYTLNKNQLVIKYTEFLSLLNAILVKAKKEPLLTAINKDKSQFKVKKEFESFQNIISDVKEAMKDATFEKAAEFALNKIIKIAKDKLGL
ncbi:MAG: hypothetical protein WCP69_04830 [Bacteroidota bacterium]